MKLRATVLLFAAFCFLVTSPAWAQIPSICDGTPGNLVANCGFETGSFSSWSHTGNLGFTGVSPYPSNYVNSGLFGAQLGPIGSDGFLTQNIWGNSWTFAFRQDPAYWGLDDITVTFVGSCGVGCGLYNASFYLYNDGGTRMISRCYLTEMMSAPICSTLVGSPISSMLDSAFRETLRSRAA